MTKRTVTQPPPRSGDEVEKIAQSVAEKASKGDFVIQYSDHARDQMEARLIDEKHVLLVLKYGRVVEDEERWNEEEGEYSYLIRDPDVDGRDMALSIAVDDSTTERVLIVTAMLIDPYTGKFI